MGEAVNFKGNKDGIVLLLDLTVEFESLCQMIVHKLWTSRSFLGEHTAGTAASIKSSAAVTGT